jgi:hypothetical protein
LHQKLIFDSHQRSREPRPDIMTDQN